MNREKVGMKFLRLLTQISDQWVTKPVMRRWPKRTGRPILCFGDSNTWGSKPDTGLRYPFRHRWPGVLQSKLGKDFLILEEGLSGRTTVLDDPDQWGRNGKKALVKCLDRYSGLDLVIILLGTNDLKDTFERTPKQIAQGMEELGRMVLSQRSSSQRTVPLLMLVSPPAIDENGEDLDLFQEAIAKSVLLASEYRRVADKLECDFFDAGEVIQSSPVDGVHWEQESHRKLGQVMAKKVKELLGRDGLCLPQVSGMDND